CKVRLPCRLVRREVHEHPDASHTGRLLRSRHHRPRSRAEKCDEFPPPHGSPLARTELYHTIAETVFCVTANFGGECPLWVISRHCRRTSDCPLYPQEHTSLSIVGTSAWCR